MNFVYKILKPKYFKSPLKSAILLYYLFFSKNNRTEKNASIADYN